MHKGSIRLVRTRSVLCDARSERHPVDQAHGAEPAKGKGSGGESTKSGPECSAPVNHDERRGRLIASEDLVGEGEPVVPLEERVGVRRHGGER